MTHYEPRTENSVSLDELRSLAAVKGRCITATVSIPEPAHIRPRINNAVRELEKRLKELQIDVRTGQRLMDPLRELAATVEADGDWAVALAIYRSEGIFRCFRLPGVAREISTIADRFQIRPLLAAITREQRFCVLALSQKHVRVFDCTNYRITEIDVKGRVPQNLNVFLSTKPPDHALDNRSSGGPGVGSMKGVTFGTGSDRDRQNEYLSHFFREIDRGIQKVLTPETPLMLAGVEEELALYRRMNTYKHLLPRDIHGSPEGVAPPELRRRAMDITRRELSSAAAHVVAEFESYRRDNRVLFDVPQILVRASEGRIADLLIREDAEYRGVWDDVTHQAVEDKTAGDLINIAALETLSHGGQAFVLRADEMPGRAAIAATVRY